MVQKNNLLTVNVPALFKVTLKDKDAKQLKEGDDDIEVIINGPNKKPINENIFPIDLHDGTYNIEFTPKEPGKYLIETKVLGKNIKGVPLELVCGPPKLLGDAYISSRTIDLLICDEKRCHC